MKKIAAFFLSLMLLLTISYGQTLSKQNVVAYNNQEECKSGILLQELMANDPSYAQKIANYNKLVQQGNPLNKGTVYNIPVVVHVIHLGEPEGTGTNISDAQIHSAINNLNQAFRNQAPYTGVDMEINFCLASVDPSGNPTSGINRVNGSGTSDYATQGITNDGGSSMNEVAVKALSNWGNTNYYQFWIVAGIDGNMGGGGTQGYAYFSQAASKDGAVILYNSFGYDPTGTLCYNLKSYTNQNVTTTHEVGHAFGLYHTFEGDGTGSTCPTNNDCSTDGDRVCDTPPHKRSASDCVVATNTCTGGSSSDHIHNFMDYSSDDCQTEFTANQVTRARAWLLSSRASLTTSTKCNPVAVPVSNFEAVCGSQSGCAGSSINFFDLSEGNPTSWSWSFPGGSPATSTTQYPTVSYATPGTYVVTLTATNSFGTGNTETKSGFITIYSSPTATCQNVSSNPSGNYGYAISNVTFNEINNTTSTIRNGEYQDFSCSNTTVVEANQTYNLSVTAYAGNSGQGFQYRVYIDYNNDGAYSNATELITTQTVPVNSNATHNQNVTIPGTAVTGALLRLRVVGDYQTVASGCESPLIVGDVEDYGVYINPAGSAPVADFSGTPTTLCAGSSVSFSDLSTNTPTSWSWTFTGGTPSSSTSQNPTITYNTAGVYQVVLTATNASGSDGETKVGYITVNAAPSISSQPSNSVITEGNNTSFSVIASNATGYQWQVNTGSGFGNISNGGVYSNATTATLNITGATLAMNGYTYRCIASGNCTPTATSNSATLTVNPAGSAPVANFSTNATTICAGESINFTDLSSNTPTAWLWDFGDGGMSTSKNTIYTYNVAGTYTVTLTASNAFGSDDTIRTNLITVNALPTINTSSTNETCAKNDGTATASGGGTYSWNTLPIQNNAVATGLAEGTYTVTVTTNGCSAQQNVTVNSDNCVPNTEVKAEFCGITVSNLTDVIKAYFVSTANEYQFRATEQGVGTVLTFNYGRNNISMAWFPGIKYNTTYSIDVRVRVGANWGLFSNACNITTPAIPSPNVTSNVCNTTLVNLTDLIYVKPINKATNYEYKLTEKGTSNVYFWNNTIWRVALSWFGSAIKYNTVYELESRAYVNGAWSNFSPICEVTTPAIPIMSVTSSQCGAVVNSLSELIYFTSVQQSSNYEYKLTEQGTANVYYWNNTIYRVALGWFGSVIQPSTVYELQARAYVNGDWGSYSSICEVTTPSFSRLFELSSSRLSNQDEGEVINNPTTLSIYPNPNSGEQLNVNLEYLYPNSTLTITDIYGKVILTKQLNTDQSEYKVNVKFENKLSAGFYLVSISSEGNTITEKLIVR